MKHAAEFLSLGVKSRKPVCRLRSLEHVRRMKPKQRAARGQAKLSEICCRLCVHKKYLILTYEVCNFGIIAAGDLDVGICRHESTSEARASRPSIIEQEFYYLAPVAVVSCAQRGEGRRRERYDVSSLPWRHS